MDSSEVDEGQLSEAEATGLVVRAVAALVLLVLCAGVAVALTRGEGDGGGTLDQDTVRPSESGLVSTGPVVGTDVATYAARRRADLARLSGNATAIVSFTGYRTHAAAAQALDGVRLRAVLVAAKNGAPTVVEGALSAWATTERRDAEGERANLLQMLKDTTDPEFIAQFKSDVARLTALLSALDPNGPVVFGAIVEGSAAALRSLVGPGVRLIDPVGRHVPAELSALHGVRPEETVKVGDPPTRP